MTRFKDRREAGQQLAAALRRRGRFPRGIALALAPGGVAVAFEVARLLALDLDVVLVHELRLSRRGGLAIGVIVSGGFRRLDEALLAQHGVSRQELLRDEGLARLQLEQREREYRGSFPRPLLTRRSVLLVDDGASSPVALEAVAAAVRVAKPARVTVALPVGAQDACRRLTDAATEVVCVATPRLFGSASRWYEDFSPLPASTVRMLLADAWGSRSSAAGRALALPPA